MDNTAVPVKSVWMSKINWTAAFTAALSLIAAFGFNIPDSVKTDLLALVGVGGSLLTVVLRTWFTTSVLAPSIPEVKSNG